jgi:hypothetical protein
VIHLALLFLALFPPHIVLTVAFHVGLVRGDPKIFVRHGVSHLEWHANEDLLVCCRFTNSEHWLFQVVLLFFVFERVFFVGLYLLQPVAELQLRAEIKHQQDPKERAH